MSCFSASHDGLNPIEIIVFNNNRIVNAQKSMHIFDKKYRTVDIILLDEKCQVCLTDISKSFRNFNYGINSYCRMWVIGKSLKSQCLRQIRNF